MFTRPAWLGAAVMSKSTSSVYMNFVELDVQVFTEYSHYGDVIIYEADDT